MTDITLGSRAGSLPHTWLRPRQCSLADDLANRSIPIIPIHLVREQKREEVRKNRPGALRYIGPPVTLFLRGIALVSLIEFVYITERRLGSHKVPKWIGSAVGWLMAAPFVAGFFAGLLNTFSEPVLSWWLVGSLITPMSAYFLTMAADRLVWQILDERAVSWWQRTSAMSAEGGVYQMPMMPERIFERAKKAATIPDVRIAVDSLGPDPFLLVLRGWGPFTEKFYIGAWDTGNPALDNI